MKYTYQTISESGSFSPPQGGDVNHATSKKQLIRALDNWIKTHNQVGSDTAMASLLVWRGHLDDVTDFYPDYLLKAGPRGGVLFLRC